jgi:NAD(P)-dependent dehydrogenase (short-subunit alcohol dehydrogenase family)
MRQVLITGASRGLGLELVKQYVARGNVVLFAACRQGAEAPALKALLGGGEDSARILPVRLDVTCPSSVAALRETLEENDGAKIDVLWNNAVGRGEVESS